LLGYQGFAKVSPLLPPIVDAGVKVRNATTVQPYRLVADEH
jgi:hypothetical protein